MKIYRNPEEFRSLNHSIVTIGTFDGVHLGHQKIISRLLEIKKQKGGESLIFTFDPHPRLVLFPETKNLRLITTTSEKIFLLKKFGIDHVIVFPFNMEFAALSASDYIKNILLKQLKTDTLVIGYDHRFGKEREGNIETLIEYSKHYGFQVEEIPAHDVDSINVSSSLIREALLSGDIKTANAYLGYTYFFEGKVIRGKQLGRTIGYPTANIQIPDPLKLIPNTGVYAVRLEYESIWYKGMMSIGVNPTTDADNLIKIEVNIFEFNEVIYDKMLRIEVIERLRDEQKFSNLEELKIQLGIDKDRSLDYLAIF